MRPEASVAAFGGRGSVVRTSVVLASSSARRRARSLSVPSARDWTRHAHRLNRNSPLPVRVGSPKSSWYFTRSCAGAIRRSASTVCSMFPLLLLFIVQLLLLAALASVNPAGHERSVWPEHQGDSAGNLEGNSGEAMGAARAVAGRLWRTGGRVRPASGRG